MLNIFVLTNSPTLRVMSVKRILFQHINLPNSHPSVLCHCYLFLVKNRVFGLLDWIAPKLP